MNENDIVEILCEMESKYNGTACSYLYISFKEDIAKAIMDKIREEEKPNSNLPDSFDAYMELPYAEKIKLFKKG